MSEGLDNRVKNWLDEIEKINQETVSTTRQKTIAYILKIENNQPIIDAYYTYLKKNNTLSSLTSLNMVSLLDRLPDYLTSHDILIFTVLSTITRASTDIKLSSVSRGKELFDNMVQTGRLFYETTSNPPLTMDKAKLIEIGWQINDDGNQKIAAIDLNIELIALEPPMYLDKENFKVGLINSKIDSKLLKHFISSPTLAPEQINDVVKKLNNTALEVSKNLLPKKIANSETIKIEPKLVLELASIRIFSSKMRKVGEMGKLSIAFDYEGKIFKLNDKEKHFHRYRNNKLQKIERSSLSELALTKRLKSLGNFYEMRELIRNNFIEPWHLELAVYDDFLMFDNLYKPDMLKVEEDWHAFIKGARANGWVLKIAHDFPYNVFEEADEYLTEINDIDNDWFNVTIGVTVGGEKIDLIPVLVKILKDDDVFNMLKDIKTSNPLIDLGNGRKIRFNGERLAFMLTFLKEVYDKVSNGELKLSKIDAALLAELDAASKALGIRWFNSTKLNELRSKLCHFKGIKEIVVPANFQANLRSYQQEGVNWLQFLAEYELAGILADDMGLGKTIQTLAHIMVEKEKGLLKPFLVIAPTSVIPNWMLESARFAPTLKVTMLRAGSARKQIIDSLSDCDILLTTYPLILRDKELLLKHEFHTIILDEAQFIKNNKAKVTQIVNQLKAKHRICLTGTPLENHLGELWSLFNFLMPGYLGSHTEFTKNYRTPIEKHGTETARQSLFRKIQPFILRRTKDKVATELPSKTEIIQISVLDEAQADLYETIRVSMHSKISQEIASKGLARSHIIILDALLKLRQICCHPQLLKMEAAKDVKNSAKLDQLMSMIPSMIEEGRKIVLFSQFVSMIEIIEGELAKLKIKYVKIIGDTKDRIKPIEEFQKGKVAIFLISLKAGGTGINLTAADTVIHYDPWWNPAVEQQATDRVYRIGQDKPVFVYKMISGSTVEEKILEMQKRKAKLADAIFDPEAKSSAKITAEEINDLFSRD